MKSSPVPAYETLSDEQLAQMSERGDNGAFSCLVLRYMPVIRANASRYYAAGFDTEDFAQEGMIGLLKAVRGYQNGAGAAFKTFAGLCIQRCIISAFAKQQGLKNVPASRLVSLNQYQGIDSEQESPAEADASGNPEALVINKESIEHLRRQLKDILTSTEYSVMNYYLAGCSYSEMACYMEVSEKSVDNALQRAKRKIKTVIANSR